MDFKVFYIPTYSHLLLPILKEIHISTSMIKFLQSTSILLFLCLQLISPPTVCQKSVETDRGGLTDIYNSNIPFQHFKVNCSLVSTSKDTTSLHK